MIHVLINFLFSTIGVFAFFLTNAQLNTSTVKKELIKHDTLYSCDGNFKVFVTEKSSLKKPEPQTYYSMRYKDKSLVDSCYVSGKLSIDSCNILVVETFSRPSEIEEYLHRKTLKLTKDLKWCQE